MLLFFIQDHQAQILQRRKHRAAGPPHTSGPALLDHPPLQQPLGVVQRRVLHRHPVAEALLQAADHLGGQADLGHQHQRRLSLLQGALDQLQKHQRFAAGGHAVQQRRGGFSRVHLGGQALKHCLLRPGQLQRFPAGGDVGVQVNDLIGLAFFQHSLCAQVIQHRAGKPQLRQLALGQRAVFQRLHRSLLPVGRVRLGGQFPCQPV